MIFSRNRNGERLDIGAVGQFRVGHDRGRIGIDQHNFDPFGAKRLDRLRAGIIKLACLADHDRAGADHQNRFMSVRLGMAVLFLPLLHQGHEAVKKGMSIVRAGGGFGVDIARRWPAYLEAAILRLSDHSD